VSAPASPRSVFLDTGIFIAFLDRSDRWHPEARALFATAPRAWATSLLVVGEAHGWFLHRMGEEAARRFHELLTDMRGLRLFDVTRTDHQATLAMLDRLHGAKLTYVDASSLALLAKHRIGTVWSTDRHLGLTGVRVVP
jgi:predicted nucleic acid-binding protein